MCVSASASGGHGRFWRKVSKQEWCLPHNSDVAVSDHVFFSVAVYHPRGIISWEDNPGELEVFHMFFRQTFCFGAESHPTCCFVLCRSIPKAEPLHRPAFHAPLDQHKYGNPCMFLRNDLNWLVVWNMNFIVPYIGNNHPN